MGDPRCEICKENVADTVVVVDNNDVAVCDGCVKTMDGDFGQESDEGAVLKTSEVLEIKCNKCGKVVGADWINHKCKKREKPTDNDTINTEANHG